MKLSVKLINAVGVLLLLYIVVFAATFSHAAAATITGTAGVMSAIYHVSAYAKGNYALSGIVIPDFKVKSEDDIEKLDLVGLAEYRKAEREFEIMTRLKAYDDERQKLDPKTDAAKIEEHEKTISLMKAELNAFGLKMKAIAEKGKAFGTGETLVEQLKANVEILKQISKGVTEKEIEIKASTLVASITNNTQAQDVPSVGQLATRELTMYDMFPKITMGTNNKGQVRYWDWDPDTTVRAADYVLEGQPFPESTAKWIEYTLPLKKIGDTIPVSEEFYEDEQMFAAELDLFLNTNVALKIDDEICNGTGGAELTGLFQSIPAFNPALVTDVAYATFYDLLVKMRETITKTGGAKYKANFAVMNISAINKMRLTKDANNNYILPPFVSRDGQMVDSMVVLESNVVPDNALAIGDRRFAKIYEKAGFVLSRGYKGDQFVEDMETLKVRKRILFLIRNVDRTGFVKVTNIDAAIAAINLAS